MSATGAGVPMATSRILVVYGSDQTDGMVREVRALSRQEGVAAETFGPPLGWEEFAQELGNGYDVLWYVGHYDGKMVHVGGDVVRHDWLVNAVVQAQVSMVVMNSCSSVDVAYDMARRGVTVVATIPEEGKTDVPDDEAYSWAALAIRELADSGPGGLETWVKNSDGGRHVIVIPETAGGVSIVRNSELRGQMQEQAERLRRVEEAVEALSVEIEELRNVVPQLNRMAGTIDSIEQNVWRMMLIMPMAMFLAIVIVFVGMFLFAGWR